MILAKIALGVGGTLALAGAYTFHEGVMRVSVDEYRPGGSHIHFFLPAAVIPMAVHLAPRAQLKQALCNAKDKLPLLKTIAKEFRKYPDAEWVDVKTITEHVSIRTAGGKLYLDANTSEESVHLSLPLAAIQNLAEELESRAAEPDAHPGA